MEAAYIMAFVRYSKGIGQVLQVLGSLVNMHVVAELAQQVQQARAELRQRARVVRQQVQAIVRTGEQEIAQDVVAQLGIEAEVIEILFKDDQIVLRQAAYGIQRGDIIRRSVQCSVLQIAAHEIVFRLFFCACF